MGITFSGAVVAKMKTVSFGGSSTTLRSALKPWVLIICASSRMMTLYLSLTGENWTCSLRLLASSTLLWLAASISMTSKDPDPPLPSSRQLSHFPQGCEVGPSAQFRHLARILAQLVFPHPLGPEKR